jgi:hypothetical protein
MLTKTDVQRDRLIRNVLRVAAERGLLLTVGTMLDAPVRIHDRETDLPVWVPLRALRADDARAE